MEENRVSASQEDQLVVFRLGREAFGIDIGRVQGIERMQAITVVPRAPAFIEGVINLRGQVTPVMCLRTRFGLGKAEQTKETRIVVVRVEEKWIGLVVDAVQGVLRITKDKIEPPSALVTSEQSEYLRGIAKTEDSLLILLDLDKVLSWHDLVAIGPADELEAVGLGAAA